MIDREKVIKGLEICTSMQYRCADCPYYANCCLDGQEVMENALALLKEQEPVEPKEIINDFYPVGDYRRTLGWHCGKCGRTLMGDGDFCSYCGQAVKWE